MEESAGDRVLNSLANRLLQLDGLVERQRLGPTGDNIPEDTREFVNKMKNQNTARKTDGNIRKLKSWLVSNGERRDITEIPAPDLNIYLARFYMLAKQDNGQDYEPTTLKSFQSSFQRYLHENGYPCDTIKDREFQHSREVLASKQKELKSKGLGNRKRKAEAINDSDLKQMVDQNVLGFSNPEALLNTVYLNNSFHFGLRGRQEHINMLWGNVEPKTNSNGQRYLEFTERETKTRNGINGDIRQYPPKMFEKKDDPLCPVKAYEEYKKGDQPR